MNHVQLLERVVALLGKPPPDETPEGDLHSKVTNLATAACALAELGHWDRAITLFRKVGDTAGPGARSAWYALAEELARAPRRS